MTELDDRLAGWDEVKAAAKWSSILVGNGFSQNVWQKFGYQSLFETASGGEGARLNEQDTALFEKLGTKNFEAVLSALSTAKAVVGALGADAEIIEKREKSIREALIRAVHAVHAPWADMQEDTLNHIAGALSSYSAVYCTNYDLLTYWAMMRQPGSFKDYFWSEAFDVADTEIRGDVTKVHFLHGGLHLYRRPNGQTLKRRAGEHQNLLTLFGTPYRDAIPLFVSEGSDEEKLSSIYRSDYLSFVFAQLASDAEPMVIFGSGLGEADQHIVTAIGSRKGREVAVSMRAEGNIRQKKAATIKMLPEANICFFDAATHPLGRPELTM